MARRAPPGGEGRPARRTTGDPYGLAAARPFLAPILSLVGLAVVGLLTLGLLSGNLPFLPARNADPGGQNNPGSGGPVVPGKTPSPSEPPVVNPDVGIDGRLVYAKAGNLWIQEGTASRRLTNTGRDSQPAWSADGAWVYFIETRKTTGPFSVAGIERRYDIRYPLITRVRPDGTGRETLISGLYRSGPSKRYTWFFFMRDLAVSPDGKQLALVSDGTDPTGSNVVLQTFDIARVRLAKVGLPEQAPLGHQNPTWSPDGKYILYVKNGRQGARGLPTLWRYEVATKKNTALTGPGYTEPSYSADGRRIVATKTTSLGTDIVVLDARTGIELLRVTSDGRSWGGAWSPDGTQIAFLRLVGLTVDLNVATLESGTGGALAVKETKPLTEFSGLDAESRPAWWGPRPTPAPTATPAAPTATPAVSPTTAP
jgi:Tol biopolymer transport system component